MNHKKSNNPDPLLQVINLKVQFKNPQTDSNPKWVTALNQVGFSLYKGEFLGILGESGCGKSLTALSIMRLLPHPLCRISSGNIYFQGQDILSLQPEQLYRIRGKKISMIFQDPMTALNPVQSVGKQIQEVFLLHFPSIKSSHRKKACEEMINRVGIAEPIQTMKKFPHQLSGGMRQRILIAMALLCEPDILIADEPTTALDVTIQAQIMELIRSLGKKMNMAVMLITHDVGLIAQYCSRIMVMYAGKVVEIAHGKEILANPRHPYTQGLLKCVPSINASTKALLPTIQGQVPSLINMPQGCSFTQRCPYSMEICHTTSPKMHTGTNEHQTACYLQRS